MRASCTILLAVFCMLALGQEGDQTVGVFLNTQESFNGYTLMAPMVSRKTHLIDNCGYVVNQWDSEYRPGLSAYLLEDGDLLRTCFIPSQFISGGSGGRVERFSWDGELEWGYDYSSDLFHQHHDIEPLPNGNVLLIAWEAITREEAIALGRDSTTVSDGGLWPDHIVEIQPFGTTGGTIAWEWHITDHIVQDYDSTKANFGEISAHPELVDINRTTFNGFPSGADWNHCNGIDYLPEHDLIVLSSRNFSEIWVIDHGTTTEEAAGHSGGQFGKGGDILYRWGNPASYGRGTSLDRMFYGQHDAQWIAQPNGRLGIQVFNNGVMRPEGRYSSVDDIILPELSDTGFVIEPGEPFGPAGLNRTFDGDGDFEFYSSTISGAHRQPNGNTLICVGGRGELIEVDSLGAMVWKYINPDAGSPITQGNPSGANNMFKVFRYGPDYPAFDGRDLDPGDRIELEPLRGDCELFPGDTTTSTVVPFVEFDVEVLENPASRVLRIRKESSERLGVSILSASGTRVYTGQADAVVTEVDVSRLIPGLYFVLFQDYEGKISVPKKVVIQ